MRHQGPEVMRSAGVTRELPVTHPEDRMRDECIPRRTPQRRAFDDVRVPVSSAGQSVEQERPVSEKPGDGGNQRDRPERSDPEPARAEPSGQPPRHSRQQADRGAEQRAA